MAQQTRPGAGRTATCKYCGATGLRWGHDARRLIDYRTGVLHTCQEYRNQTPNPTATPSYRPVDDGQSAAEIMQAATGTSLSKADVESIAQRISVNNDSIWIRDLSTKLQATETSVRNSLETILKMMAEKERESKASRTIEVKMPDGTKRDVGRQHKNFPDLVTYVSMGFNTLLVGPAGSGKTTAAEKVAEALGFKFYLQPMGPAITESRLLGWVDANGKIVRTGFRDCYEHGGVFMADEMDNSNASALTVLNGALANGHVGFPDGMVKRHPNFRFVGGANTYGRGADRMYVGRQQLDAATLDRFLVIDWDYDTDFELILAGTDQREWVEFVWKVRNIVFTNKMRELVTPRASIEGAALLRAGIDRAKVEQVRLFAGMSAESVSKIRENLRYGR